MRSVVLLLVGFLFLGCAALELRSTFPDDARVKYEDTFFYFQKNMDGFSGYYVVSPRVSSGPPKWKGKLLMLTLQGNVSTPDFHPQFFDVPATYRASKPQEVQTLVFTQLLRSEGRLELLVYIFDLPSKTVRGEFVAKSWEASTEPDKVQETYPDLWPLLEKRRAR